MHHGPRVLLWPRVATRWRWGTDWCAPARVLETVRRLDAIVAPESLRDPDGTKGVVLVFDTPTGAFLQHVVPALVDASIPFAISVATAHVRTRSPRNGRSGLAAITWRELRALIEWGVTVAVRGHDVTDVARLPDELAFGQLATARQELIRRVEAEPWLWCDPQTPSRPEIARMARELGFSVGAVRRSARAWPPDSMRRPAVVPRPWQTTQAILREVAAVKRAPAQRATS